MNIDGTQKIRVLQLGNPLGLYGAERWILALVRHLPAATVESIVGVIKDDPAYGVEDLCTYAEALGLEAVHFEAHGKLSFSAIGKIRQYILENNVDILHTHGYKTDLIGLLAVRGTCCRIISTPHGWSTKAGFKVQCYETLDRLAFLMMDAVVPLSSRLYDGLVGIPGLSRKLHLIRNGVDLAEIDDTPRDAGPAMPSNDPDTLVVGYIGQLIERKGIDTLIRAFRDLQMSNKQLWLIGEGPQRASLEQLASELGVAQEVRFLGFREDRIALLKRFDVFALASSLEGIPRCLLESMAAEVPVVATRIPGCTDLVTHEVSGLLFELGDVTQLTAHLQRLSDDRPLRDTLVRNAHQLVTTEYSAAAMANKYAALYETLVDARNADGEQPAGRSLSR